MSWPMFFAGGILIAISFFAGRGCSSDPVSIPDSQYIHVLENKIDSIKTSIASREVLLANSHDTVIYITRQVNNTITEYLTETDTIIKLQKCDELARDCEELSEQCIKNDSLHNVQQQAKDIVIRSQDTVISSIKADNSILVKNNRLLKIGAGAGVLATVLAIVFR